MAGRFSDDDDSARRRHAAILRRHRQAEAEAMAPSVLFPPAAEPVVCLTPATDDFDDGVGVDDDLPDFVERYADTGTCPCGGTLGPDHYVWMAFLNYDNDEEGYRREQFARDYRALAVNWWTTVLSGSNIFHCQMFFWNEHQQTFITYSVDAYAKRVFADTKKQFSRGWTFLRVPVTREQEVGMYEFFVAQLAAAKPFNSFGAYMLFFRPIDQAEEQSWFCSQLDVAALQRAGFLHGVPPHATSPAALYRLMKERAEFSDVLETDNPVRVEPVTAVVAHRQVPIGRSDGSMPPPATGARRMNLRF